MVFCHGGPGLWDYLGPLAALVDERLTVHRFDQRGCGRSTGRDGQFTIGQAVEDLEAVRRHFGHDRWSLLGHSWGAELVLHYAAAHPERTHRVAYVSGVGAGFGYRDPHRAESERRLGPQRLQRLAALEANTSRTGAEERERCLLAWLPDFSPSADAAALAAQMYELRPPGVAVNQQSNRGLWLDRATVDLLAICDRITAPVLMLHGRDDPRPVSAKDSLLAALPHATRSIIEAAGHEPWTEQPRQAAELLRTFMSC